MSHSHSEPPSPVAGFAAALAEHLPGHWQAGAPTSVAAQEAGSDRIWHSGPLAYAALDAADVQRCVLTSPYGLQLYVLHGHTDPASSSCCRCCLPAAIRST